MTVPISGDNDGETIKNTIDLIFSRPVETLEMLQNKFTSNPTTVPNKQSLDDEDSLLFHEESEKISDWVTDFQNIALSDGDIAPTALCEEENVPLVKVDNFVDDYSTFSSYNPTTTQDESVNLEDIIQAAVKDKFNHSCSSYTVKVINTIHDTDPLPGEAIPVLDNPTSSTVIELSNLTARQDIFHEEKHTDGKNDDVVHEFTLDKQFDYDSVTLTPKFDINALISSKNTGNS